VRLLDPNAPRLMVADRSGALLFLSTDLAAWLRGAEGMAGGADGDEAAAQLGGGGGAPVASAPLAGFTLHDFMPAPWKDLHGSYLKASRRHKRFGRWSDARKMPTP
jgi:hypothetical protein